MKEKKHKFSDTHFEVHDDGSMFVHHQHEEDPKKDVKHAVSDLDGLHDSLQDNLNPEEDEEKLEEQVHPGIHSEIMKMAKKED